jgi:hypothetical protein
VSKGVSNEGSLTGASEPRDAIATDEFACELAPKSRVAKYRSRKRHATP